MSAIDAEVVAGDEQREQRADARRRQRREDRHRVDVALVEHAEHDVDGDERGEDEQRLVARATRGTPARCPGSAPTMLAGSADPRDRSLDRVDRLAERNAGRGVERERHDGELALVLDRRAARARSLVAA